METIIKIVIILVLITIYVMTMKNCFEYFAVLPFNSKISTSNKTDALKDRHPIDSIDIDINTSENSYYYEFSNEKYLDLLVDIFNPYSPEKYIILRNIEWETETDSTITAIYNKAYQFISNKIAENTPDIQIVHDLLIKYKKDEEKQAIDHEPNGDNLSSEITKLNELLKNGVLTQEEFEKAKKKLLDN